ncbi:MAG: hypothetical protein COA99_16770 [Moraxellaceae bacterium]|nr:MAG: hypothetical protein COA99_16770 [Moraxellaceae bacterium]
MVGQQRNIKNTLLCASLAVCAFNGMSYAQESTYDEANPSNLETIPGLNSNQKKTVRAIHNTCTDELWPITNGGANPENLTDLTRRDLFFRCTSMIVTGDVILGNLASHGLGLALTEDEYAIALNAIANEEAAGQGSSVKEVANSQIANVNARMQAVRAASLGLSINGFDLQLNDRQITGLANVRGGNAGSNPGKLGFFVNGTISNGDKDETLFEDGFDFYSTAITIGIDYRFSDSLVAGIAVGINEVEIEIDNDFDTLDNDAISYIGFASYFFNNIYVDGLLSFTQTDYESKRRVTLGTSSNDNFVDRVASGDTEGDQLSYSVGVGYFMNRNQLNVDYSLRLNVIDATVDGFDESSVAINTSSVGEDSLSLRLNDQDIESVQVVLGISTSYAISQDFGVITPHVRINLHNEFEDDARDIVAAYVHAPDVSSFTIETDDEDSSYATIAIGLAAVLKGGTQFFIDYETVTGLDDISHQTISFGSRLEF